MSHNRFYKLTITGISALAAILVALLLTACNNAPPVRTDINCADVTEIPQEECQALLDLYKATDGPNWKDSPDNNWNITTTPCTDWSGVTCDRGHVTIISRASAKLNGALPSSIGDLVLLQDLYLEYNRLSGAIPLELSTLSGLQYLWLSGNQLSGAIPPELAGLTGLRVLQMDSNQLSGAIPPELAKLSYLGVLHLANNQLSGAIPPEFGNLTNLTVLDLSNNRLAGEIQFVSRLSKLITLNLGNNQLSGVIPPELGGFTDLRALDLSKNQLSGAIPPELGNLVELQSLSLFGNQLSGAIPPELGNLVKLDRLYLNANALTGAIPPAITRLGSLKTMDLAYNDLWAQDQNVTDFLDAKNPNWAKTQTIAPTTLSATQLGDGSVQVTWQPIPYTQDGGHYQVHYSLTPGGPYTPADGVTADKTINSYTLEGLAPGTVTCFVVTTFTPPHAYNSNPITSTFSNEVTIASP